MTIALAIYASKNEVNFNDLRNLLPIALLVDAGLFVMIALAVGTR